MTHQTARGRLIVVIGGLVFGPLALWACYGGSLGSLGYACAFSEGTSQACYVLERLGLTSATESYMGRDSWMRVAEHTMRISVERRLRTEEMECAAGELWGCYQLALDLSVSEDQTSTDLARAAQLFERVCHHAGPTDSPWGAPYGTFVAQGACVALGDAYRHGDGVEQNVAQARQVYTDVCDASDQGIGCSELAHMMFAAGEDRGEVRRL
ncbi:MAG: SEL1-like repeat protein, partial [Myxococcales bacterium]|nr:SEL1-like repeat protein [Myxococcales bacterium]